MPPAPTLTEVAQQAADVVLDGMGLLLQQLAGRQQGAMLLASARLYTNPSKGGLSRICVHNMFSRPRSRIESSKWARHA
jgi:hypothetical protein